MIKNDKGELKPVKLLKLDREMSYDVTLLLSYNFYDLTEVDEVSRDLLIEIITHGSKFDVLLIENIKDNSIGFIKIKNIEAIEFTPNKNKPTKRVSEYGILQDKRNTFK
jgi:hypothetical protein